jgi:hypothetical protein
LNLLSIGEKPSGEHVRVTSEGVFQEKEEAINRLPENGTKHMHFC